jgi:ribosomal protein L2
MVMTPLQLISRKLFDSADKNSGGRNSQGKMTMRYTGGGHKQRYRIIDFKEQGRNSCDSEVN